MTENTYLCICFCENTEASRVCCTVGLDIRESGREAADSCLLHCVPCLQPRLLTLHGLPLSSRSPVTGKNNTAGAWGRTVEKAHGYLKSKCLLSAGCVADLAWRGVSYSAQSPHPQYHLRGSLKVRS